MIILVSGGHNQLSLLVIAPVKDHEILGRALAALGQSRLSSNLNQLAKAVNSGTLPVHPETEAEIVRACSDVSKIRSDFLRVLGLDGEML